MSYLNDVNSVFSIDVVYSLAQQIFNLIGTVELEIAISRHLGAKSIKGLKKVNLGIDSAGKHRKLQLNELKEI